MLSVLWFGAAVIGAVACAIAFVAHSVRDLALIVAGTSFAIAGVLGIFSIGIVFIGLAALCFSRIGQPSHRGPAPPAPPWQTGQDKK